MRPELVGMDMSGGDERRALHFAVLRSDAAMVKLLMKAGADARKGVYPHRAATSALALARDRGDTAIVELIEEEERRRCPNATVSPVQDQMSDARPGAEVPLFAAVARGDLARIHELLSANPEKVREIGPEGGLLTVAVKRNQLETARLLLDLGADVDERVFLSDLEEPTLSWGGPLWHAARVGQLEMCELLLDRGADPNANVYASGWPLRNAWHHEDPRVKELLLARGATLPPFMVAELQDVEEARRILARDPAEAVVTELLEAAADGGCAEIVALCLPRLDWPRADGRWHWYLIQPPRGIGAAQPSHEGHFACMELLLRHGIHPDVVTSLGQTVLHFLAAWHGEIDEAERARFAGMLLDYGASLKVRDEMLWSTPLAWACRWGRREMVEVLIARGAAVDEPDAAPWATPVAWAEKMGHADLLAVLRRGR
jgi:ankyrin repeat protein